MPVTFLVAEAEGQIVGRVSIRHALNAHLAEVGRNRQQCGDRPDRRLHGLLASLMGSSPESGGHLLRLPSQQKPIQSEVCQATVVLLR